MSTYRYWTIATEGRESPYHVMAWADGAMAQQLTENPGAEVVTITCWSLPPSTIYGPTFQIERHYGLLLFRAPV